MEWNLVIAACALVGGGAGYAVGYCRGVDAGIRKWEKDNLPRRYERGQ